MRVVDGPRDLSHLPHYEAVFIVSRTIVRPCPVADHQYLQRTDGSLVIWGDAEDTTLGFWIDMIWRIQSQSGTAAIPTTTTSVAGLPGFSGFNPDGTILLGNTLSILDEFNLLTFADCLPPGPWGADCEATTSTHPPLGLQQATNAPSEGSLGVCVTALCAYDILSPLSSCSLLSRSVHIRLSAMPPPPLA